MQKLTTEQRFWAKVRKTDSCWLWTANLARGYGHFKLSYKQTVKAHRYAWKLYFKELPDTLDILHKCDVRNCVNPDHLFIGTAKDNKLDAMQKKRHAYGAIHGRTILTSTQVIEARKLYKEGWKIVKIAQHLTVNYHTIWNVIRRSGPYWTHV
jgi:hypothetical protein